MKIIELYHRQTPVISFEFFPPKTDRGMTNLFQTIQTLKALQPSFVSVTYGAMGSTRDKTVDLVRRLKHEAGIEAMAHLSCVGASKATITEVLEELRDADIDNVLALGGDVPKEVETEVPPAAGFTYANELAAYIKRMDHFCIAGACYPEGHIGAASKAVDLFYCRQKVEDGVDFLITQLFFDNRDYFDFVRRARAANITVPIVPGIMPITNFTQIKRFAQICGSKLPEQLQRELTPIEDDLPRVEAHGIAHATEQCRELLDAGVPGFHFYTLNKSEATSQILTNLGLG
ncbi:5,10-methylenetetrahydrofolate reductase [Candidatus Entotheonellaceae bacterium PAL068K]